MRRSKPFSIRSNDRVALVGKTGSGKTAAAILLVWQAFSDVIFYDMTGEEEDKLNAPVLRTIEEVEEALYPDNPEEKLTKFVYSPEVPTIEGFERLCELCYQHRDIHLIADELMMVYQQGNTVKPVTEHHKKIMTNGRKKGVGITGATQRPVNVPLVALSESEHVFVFKLKLGTDRDRMVKIMGEPASQARSLTNYRYVYDHDDLDEAVLCEPLDL